MPNENRTTVQLIQELRERHTRREQPRPVIERVAIDPIYNDFQEGIAQNLYMNVDDLPIFTANNTDAIVSKLKKSTPASAKKEKEVEEESNLIRIDLDKAAKELAKKEILSWGAAELESEDSETFLKVYDEYYDILFKSKA